MKQKNKEDSEGFGAYLMIIIDMYLNYVEKNLGEQEKSHMVMAFLNFFGDKLGELNTLSIGEGVSVDKKVAYEIAKKDLYEDLKKEFGE